MAKAKGIVASYDPTKKKLVCKGFPGSSYFKGGKVFIGGDKPSVCDTSGRTFQVSIHQSTADKLKDDFEFEVEYDESDPGQFKTITKFAGESIPATAPAALTLAPASEPPGSSASFA